MSHVANRSSKMRTIGFSHGEILDNLDKRIEDMVQGENLVNVDSRETGRRENRESGYR